MVYGTRICFSKLNVRVLSLSLGFGIEGLLFSKVRFLAPTRNPNAPHLRNTPQISEDKLRDVPEFNPKPRILNPNPRP